MKKRYIALIIVVILVLGIIISKPVSLLVEGRKREITYTLTYTLYGEEKTLSGTAICEFDCIGYSTNDGFKPRYCIYLEGQEEAKSENLGITVLNLREKEEPENLRKYMYAALSTEKVTGLSFSAGSAQGYMKQAKGRHVRYNLDLSIDTELYFESTGGTGYGGGYITPDAAEEVFGIRLISFEYDIK